MKTSMINENYTSESSFSLSLQNIRWMFVFVGLWRSDASSGGKFDSWQRSYFIGEDWSTLDILFYNIWFQLTVPGICEFLLMTLYKLNIIRTAMVSSLQVSTSIEVGSVDEAVVVERDGFIVKRQNNKEENSNLVWFHCLQRRHFWTIPLLPNKGNFNNKIVPIPAFINANIVPNIIRKNYSEAIIGAL